MILQCFAGRRVELRRSFESNSLLYYLNPSEALAINAELSGATTVASGGHRPRTDAVG